MLAGRAVGFEGYGRPASENDSFSAAFPLLLGKSMTDPVLETERQHETQNLTEFIDDVRPTLLPLWAGTMGEEISCVAFSPDGSRLASGSWDQTITLWSAATGKKLITLVGHTGNVTTIAFSPDGSRLASGSRDETIKLWDVVTGKEHATLAGHKSSVTSVAFSPDGSRLASGSSDKTITVWNAAVGKKVQALVGHENTVTSVAFSPDGGRLASGSSDQKVKLWDLATGKEHATLAGHNGWVTSVAFSPDGNRLASGSLDQTIKLWDVAGGRESGTLVTLATLAGLTTGRKGVALVVPHLSDIPMAVRCESVFSLAFSPDGDWLASGSCFETIRLWDARMGKELATFTGHISSAVLSITFSPDGSRLASGSLDHTIKLWDAAAGKGITTCGGHKDHVRSVAFSPDGRCLASKTWDGTIKLWDVTTGKELTTFAGGEGADAIAFSPDGSRLVSQSSGDTAQKHMIDIWDVATGKELHLNESALVSASHWLAIREHRISPDQQRIAETDFTRIFMVPTITQLDLAAPLRVGLLALSGRTLQFPRINDTTPVLHVRPDTYACLAETTLTPENRAELQMEFCAKSGQFRAARAQWQRLLKGEWPGPNCTIVTKDQAPATVPDDSPIRRLYILALFDATRRHLTLHHPAACETATELAPILTKPMLASPTISLAMMTLMKELQKDSSPEMKAPREALMHRLEEVAGKDWLDALREATSK